MSTNRLANITPIQAESFIITAATPRFPFPFTGEFVIVKSADEDMEVSVNRGSQSFPMGANGKFRMPLDDDGQRMQFDFVEFKRKAGAVVASNNVTVVIGNGDYETGKVTVAATVQVTNASTLSGANPDVVLVAATNTLLVAANAIRRCVRITKTGVVSARLSSVVADLTAGRGEIIQPGETREIFVTGAISARSAGTPTLVIGEEIF